MTFRIDGDDATYLGTGDSHDKTFDELEMTASMSLYLGKDRQGVEQRSYTSVDFDAEYNDYMIRIYPSQETKDVIVTNDASIFSSIIASVFLFTSIVFVAYDCLVAKRQRTLMRQAIASSTIVSGLFPADARKRLYEANQKTKDKKDEIKKFFRTDGEGVMGSTDGPQIASEFPECTVFFADIVGKFSFSPRAIVVYPTNVLVRIHEMEFFPPTS